MELFLRACTYNGLALNCIPIACRTKEICSAVCLNNWKATEYITNEFKNDEFTLSLLDKNGRFLQHVVSKQITNQFCLTAVKHTNSC